MILRPPVSTRTVSLGPRATFVRSGTAYLYPGRATCPGSTEGRTGQREPFPRRCSRSVTQELSMPDRATTQTVAWSTLPDAELVALARRGQRGAFRELMQ